MSCLQGIGDQQQSSALPSKHTYQEVPSSWDLLACATTFFVFPSLAAVAVGRCWCRRESAHVTLASLVELWRGQARDLHSPHCDDDPLEIAGAHASVIVLSVVGVNFDGSTTS